jgi:hypothetical protein
MRKWSVYETSDTGHGYRDIVMHRHEYHDIVLMQEVESGAWSGLLRVSSVSRDTQQMADISDFSDPKDLPAALVGKLVNIAEEVLSNG